MTTAAKQTNNQTDNQTATQFAVCQIQVALREKAAALIVKLMEDVTHAQNREEQAKKDVQALLNSIKDVETKLAADIIRYTAIVK